jgi:hypothetical protein
MACVAVRDQVPLVVQLLLEERIQLLGNGTQVMHLEVEARIASSISLTSVALALLAGEGVAREDPRPKILGVQPLPRVATVVRIRGRETVLARLQLTIVDMGLDRPALFVAELSDATASLFDPRYVVESVTSDHLPCIRHQELQNPIACAAITPAYRIGGPPTVARCKVWGRPAQAVDPVCLLNHVAGFDTQFANTPRPFLDAADRREFFTIDPSPNIRLQVRQYLRSRALSGQGAWSRAKFPDAEGSQFGDDRFELFARGRPGIYRV